MDFYLLSLRNYGILSVNHQHKDTNGVLIFLKILLKIFIIFLSIKQIYLDVYFRYVTLTNAETQRKSHIQKKREKNLK